jgi:hypothetical protein
MIDPRDNIFAARLEQKIRAILHGESAEKPGLYQGVLAAATWDDFNRTRAQVIAYEVVLNLMKDVATQMNQGEEMQRVQPQPRVN